MANQTVFSFEDSAASLYNAVVLANNLSGSDEIIIQYKEQISGSDINQIDKNSDGFLDQTEINDFVNAINYDANGTREIPVKFGGPIIQPEDLKIRRGLDKTTLGPALYGWTPSIEKSMIINLKSANGVHYELSVGSKAKFISDNINSTPYKAPGDLTAVFGTNFSSGFKIDDGDPSQKIDVTIKNLYTAPLGVNFFESSFDPSRSRSKYADLGVVIDNYENVTLENYTADSFWLLGDGKRVSASAPIINRTGADLVLKGNIVAGQAFQYRQSFLYNQGTAELDNAIVNIYDISKPTDYPFNNAFGDTRRAEGAIVNAAGARLEVNNSEIRQESSDRSNEYTSRQLVNNEGSYTATNKNQTPPDPASSLAYVVTNFGQLSFQDSQLSGVVKNDGNATFSKSHLGLSKSSALRGSNLVLQGGSVTLNQSTVDNIEKQGNGSLNQSDSIVVKGVGSGALSSALTSALDPNRPTLFVDKTNPKSALVNPLVYQGYDDSQLNTSLRTAVRGILSGSGGNPPSTPTPILSAPHITSVDPSFGSLLDTFEKTNQQEFKVVTENVADGATLKLSLNGKTYTSQALNNQASFVLPPADLARLPVGNDQLSVTGTSNGVTIPAATQSFSVEGAAPAAIPHITSVAPSFAASLDRSEMTAPQTLAVTTTGIEAGQVLTLQLDGKSAPAGVTGGSVDAAGTASFNLPVSVLSSLKPGLHQFSVSGSNQSGTAAPPAALSFSAEGPQSVTPHVLSIVPSFGASLSATEAATDQTVQVSTEGLPDGAPINLLLFGKTYTATITSSAASFTIPSADLQALPVGTDLLSITQPSSTTTVPLPSAQQSFTVEGSTPVVSPHVISIVPSFGGVLSASEAQVNQTILVGTEGVEDGQPITLSGAGLNLTDKINGGQASFTLTPAQLRALPQGLDTIQVKVSNASGVAAPTGTQSFAVEGQSFIPSPHFTSIAASFGSLLDATEVGKAQSVVVTTEGVPDSTTLTLDINSTVTYTALVSGNTATFFIPAGDLSGLNAGVDLLQVSGTTTTGTTIPSMSQAFSVDGPAPSNTPHFTNIDPTFGAVLDSSEAATNQAIGVISTGLTDGQVLQMKLNGIQYTASVSSNNASFTIPAAELQALPRGTDTLLVNAPGTATPQGSQSFTVTAPSSGGGSTGCCCTTTGGDDLLIEGGSGADTLTGGSGDDTISGGQGDDIIRGCSGDDTLSGGKGQDTLRGSSGDDLLKGRKFHDILHGGSGDDTLIGGKGQDILNGGKGSDTFKLSKGNDTIRDFSITNGDVIDAPNNLNLQLIQRDDHLLLKDSDHNIKTRLLNINRDDLLSYQPELLG